MLEMHKNCTSCFCFSLFFATLRYAIDTSFYKRTDVSMILVDYRLIYVKSNGFCDNGHELMHWSIFGKLTLELLSTRLLLPFGVQVQVRYCTESTVPCIVQLSVHFNPFISKDYGNFMNYVQLMIVQPCTAFVRNCTIVQYVTVAYRDISSHQKVVSFIFVKFEKNSLSVLSETPIFFVLTKKKKKKNLK